MKVTDMKAKFEDAFSEFNESKRGLARMQKKVDEFKKDIAEDFMYKCEAIAKEVIFEESDMLSLQTIKSQFDEIKDDTELDENLKAIAHYACMKALNECESSSRSASTLKDRLF